jgi:hypothetical protein
MKVLAIGWITTCIIVSAFALASVLKGADRDPSFTDRGLYLPPERECLKQLQMELRSKVDIDLAHGKTLVVYLGDCMSCSAARAKDYLRHQKSFDHVLLLSVDTEASSLAVDQMDRNVLMAKVVSPVRAKSLHPSWTGQWWKFSDGLLVNRSVKPGQGVQ